MDRGFGGGGEKEAFSKRSGLVDPGPENVSLFIDRDQRLVEREDFLEIFIVLSDD